MSYGHGCHDKDDEKKNGSKAVTLLLRLATLGLSLSSSVIMATASACIIVQINGVRATVTYKNFPPFVYHVGFNIATAVLESASIYLNLSYGGGGDDDDDCGDSGKKNKLAGILLIVFDVAALALSYTATGSVFAAVSAYGPQLRSCSAAGRFCQQVNLSKTLSLATSVSVGLSSVTKDVSLPFSVWPATSSDDDC
ncbi:hypothetical protein GUJ93_ZPchr0011g27203 [Zizania palustris]|uniref:CASP-like protein n=1 Tax=Zizania palustris TaxID=103762 RepID=A0A8J5WIQ0_ZIZPA|nr:hypothetical protein GUJ93_ZPchr0011g27203 [Zizania palustris]